METSLSKSERELLKALHRLSCEGQVAHTSDLADRLGVTPGTVTTAIKRLAERGIVIHRPYRGIELSESGGVLGTSTIRRHRIVERFLSDMLGYDFSDADRLASSLEHYIPEELENRLFEKLNSPQTCPHGFPIPERETSAIPTTTLLADLRPGDTAHIALPGSLGADAIEYLGTLGIRPGVELQLLEKQPFEGPLVVRVDGTDHSVGVGLAQRIYVVPEREITETEIEINLGELTHD